VPETYSPCPTSRSAHSVSGFGVCVVGIFNFDPGVVVEHVVSISSVINRNHQRRRTRRRSKAATLMSAIC
jgi:hypothetical protein